MSESRGYTPPEVKKIEPHEVFENFDSKRIEQYKRLIDIAQTLACEYTGTEAQYLNLMHALSKVEELTAVMVTESDTNIVQKEEFVSLGVFGDDLHTISHILGEATASRDRAISAIFDSKPETRESSMPALVIEYDGVVLQPDTESGDVQSGSGEWKETEFEDRLTPFVALLADNNIFLDDIIIHQSKVHKGQMRRVGYMHIEIPRLNKTVLLCNQVGEGTYVIDGYIRVEQTAKLTKTQLKETFIDKVEMVPKDSNWKDRLSELLFYDSATQRSKLDVQTIYTIRQAIQAKYSISEWRHSMSSIQYNFLPEITGRGIVAIASMFGVTSFSRQNVLSHLELGRKIYGDAPELMNLIEIESRDVEGWRTVIQKQFSAKEWVELTLKDFHKKTCIEIFKKGIKAIATIFGISSFTTEKITDHLELGRRIYGDVPEITSEIEIHNRDTDIWKEKISKKFTSAQWASASITEMNRTFPEVFNRGLVTVARMFGIVAVYKSILTHNEYLELGRCIYGDTPELAKAIQLSSKSPEGVIEMTKTITTFFSAAVWVHTPVFEIQSQLKSKIGKGFFSIASMYGLSDLEERTILDHLQLGRRIYGDVPEIMNAIEIEKLDADGWKKKISSQVTQEEWLQLSETLAVESFLKQFTGKNSTFVANKIGMVGFKRNKQQYRELGNIIFQNK
jgi:hypothetical protein